ncbi:MAG TPA: hypothetical protein VJ438_00990 [Candidatus Nanoarchaeia archaeon]|nr:hypothetical protein [Candidatus Nanoarchaeia archaeon]
MAVSKKRKKFFNVEMPLIRKETQVQAYELESIDGKFIKYDLTRMLRGKSVILQMQIKVNGKEAIAIPKQIQVLPYYLRRMMRKGTNYVEDSFSAMSKDSQLRIKPFLITRRKVSRAVRKALRNKAREEIIDYLKTKESEEIFEDILKNNLQKYLSLKLKKIYPLSLCEIKSIKVEKMLDKEKSEKEETKTSEKE